MSESAILHRHHGPCSGHHHESHRHLLKAATDAVRQSRDVDAIIVPTAREAITVKPAAELAAKLGCTLLILCSRRSTPRAVAAVTGSTDVDLIAIDVNNVPPGLLPRLDTCDLLAESIFRQSTDTSLKRNIGLLIAKLVGWQRIVFLDDDILVPDPEDLREAAGLTDTYAGVGLSIAGYPDNSTVCHAYRTAGGPQDSFIGGGALAVSALSTTSFFPNIYNEDWFFLLGDDGLRPTTISGTAFQKAYDPFADVQRARSEELGDCLAEGLFWLLDSGLSIRDAGVPYWRAFLARRVDFITDVIAMVRRMDGDPAEQRRMLASLAAARSRCRLIKPELCVQFVDGWRSDRLRWAQHVDDLYQLCAPPATGPGDDDTFDVEKLLSSLGLAHAAQYPARSPAGVP